MSGPLGFEPRCRESTKKFGFLGGEQIQTLILCFSEINFQRCSLEEAEEALLTPLDALIIQKVTAFHVLVLELIVTQKCLFMPNCQLKACPYWAIKLPSVDMII